jgi:hypothetical protein
MYRIPSEVMPHFIGNIKRELQLFKAKIVSQTAEIGRIGGTPVN